MKILTVKNGVSRRVVGKNDPLPWINKEALPVMSQMRTALNYRTTQKFYIDTLGDNTWTPVWESGCQLPYDGIWLAEAYVVGQGVTQRCSFVVHGTASSTTGVATLAGYTIVSNYELDSACDVRFSVDASARTMLLEVLDNGVEEMRFTAVISVLEGS
jgi:hypothetical protein